MLCGNLIVGYELWSVVSSKETGDKEGSSDIPDIVHGAGGVQTKVVACTLLTDLQGRLAGEGR